MPRLLRWLVGSPKGVPVPGDYRWMERSRPVPCRVRKENSSSKLVNHALLGRTNLFSGPRRGTGRVHPDLPAKIGRSVSGCRVPGAARERARSMPRTRLPVAHHHSSTFLSSYHALGASGAWECSAGPCCGGLGDAGYPCAPVLGGRGRPRSGRPQAPLEVVEKFLTRHHWNTRESS
jgi:hypothetical protein